METENRQSELGDWDRLDAIQPKHTSHTHILYVI